MQRLPKNVRIIDGRYYYRKRKNGKRDQIPLSRVDEGEYALHTELSRLHRPSAKTVDELLDAYQAHGMDDLAPKTRKSYTTWIKALRTVFGEEAPEDITPGDIAMFLERRKQLGKGPTGNRERAVLSSAYNYGMRLGLVSTSPFTTSIRRNPEKPRRRYVRDEELQALIERVNPAFGDFLQFAYLTGLRSGEIRAIRLDQVHKDRLQLDESKTDKRVIIKLSDELRALIQRCIERSRCPYLLTNTQGHKWTESALQNYLQRYRPGFTLHDLRAKAESDHDTGLGLLPRYRRNRRITPVK